MQLEPGKSEAEESFRDNSLTPHGPHGTHLEMSALHSKAAVSSARLPGGQVRPLYGSYCFSSIPGLIEKTFLGSTLRDCPSWFSAQSIGEFQRVVFVFFDAFGWESFERFKDITPVLKRFSTDGLILQSTSQFPSTTVAHVTTILSGKSAYQHEVCGWDYYEPRAGRVIRPLKFSDSSIAEPHTLASLGLTPQGVLPSGDFLRNISRAGCTVHLHGPAAYFPSEFSDAYAERSMVNGYSTVEEGFTNVSESLRGTVDPMYHYLYIDSYDSACHKEGVGSNSADRVAQDVLKHLTRFIERDRYGKTLLIVSADHGQIADRPGCSLKLQDLFPTITQYLKRDTSGNLIRFSGGARYLFLHVIEEAVPPVVQELRKKFSGAATVWTIEELSSTGFLGPSPIAESYRERLGTIAILPEPGYSVRWYEPPLFEKREFSGHGGVSPQEMETPLLLLPFS